MQTYGGHDMGLEAARQGGQHRAAGAHLIGQGREAEWHALPGIALGLSVQRLMLAELLEQHHGQQVGTRPAARNHVERRRCLAHLLASPAGNFSRTCWMTFQLRGITSSVSVISSPSLSSRALPQHRQLLGAGSTIRSRGRCAGNGRRAGRLRNIRGPRGRLLGGDLVRGRRTLQLIETQGQLVEQPYAALRPLAIELMPQLGDLQVLMCDHGLVIGRPGLRVCDRTQRCVG